MSQTAASVQSTLEVETTSEKNLLSQLYEDGQKRELTLAEQVVLQHAYFSIETESVTKQLASIVKQYLRPPGVFELVISYVCQFDPILKKITNDLGSRQLFSVVRYENGRPNYDNEARSFISLVPSFRELAQDYFEKTQTEREQKRQRRKALDGIFDSPAAANALAEIFSTPLTYQYQHHSVATTATATTSSNADGNVVQDDRWKVCKRLPCSIQ